jgi:D-3-phosphoglycerate dehydrogenase / 2-oxoglutarate reductase
LRTLVTTIPFADKDARPLNILDQAGAGVVINPLGRKLTEEDLSGMVSDADILIAGTEPITEAVLKQAPNLKLIVRVGIGLDSVDLLAARQRGIAVSYTPDAPSPAVAELTIGLMIDLLRSVNVSNIRMHHGQWYRYFGRRLSEVAIGIIGLGRIGTRVLSHLSGFKCSRILVNDIDPGAQTPSHPTCLVERTDKETIYREADVISLHVPLTAKTNNLIAREEMAAMKSDALLINTARGGIVNEFDLCQTLKSGDLGGAAIDVFEREPYSGELADLDTCLLTAHMGSMSVDCRTQMELEASAEVARFIRGETLCSPVPQAEYDNQQSSR